MNKVDKEEQYLAEYRCARQGLEEEEDELNRGRRKSEELLDSTFSDLQRIVQKFSENTEPLDEARRELERLEDEFLDVLEREKKKITFKEEEIEQIYRKKMRELTN